MEDLFSDQQYTASLSVNQINSARVIVSKRQDTKRKVNKQSHEKHPLVQKIMKKMCPPSPQMKLDTDVEQSKQGDMIQIRKEKFEINTPQKQYNMSYAKYSHSYQNGIIFEEQKQLEAISPDQQSQLTEFSKSLSTSAKEILFMKSKDNISCVPSGQAHVDFAKVEESSIMKKRKAALLRKFSQDCYDSGNL